MTINELLESQRRINQLLRAISNRHPNDVETQRAAMQATGEVADSVFGLTELLGYKDAPATKEDE